MSALGVERHPPSPAAWDLLDTPHGSLFRRVGRVLPRVTRRGGARFVKTDAGCPLGEERREYALWSTRLYHTFESRCLGGEKLGALSNFHLSSGVERMSVFADGRMTRIFEEGGDTQYGSL